MTPPHAALERLLGQIFDQFQEVEDTTTHTRQKQEFVFHMLDWTDDLQKLAELYRHPEKFGPGAGKIVAAFLYHAIPHLNAAGALLLDTIPDPFLHTDVER